MCKVYKFIKLSFVFLVGVLLVASCLIIAACNKPTNYRGLNFGRYYLENSDDVYIEIGADHKAFLNNLDFSNFNPNEYWDNLSDWEDVYYLPTKEEVVDWMQGEKNYWYFNNDKILTFLINDGHFGIEFNYNGKNQLTFENDVYILRK